MREANRPAESKDLYSTETAGRVGCRLRGEAAARKNAFSAEGERHKSPSSPCRTSSVCVQKLQGAEKFDVALNFGWRSAGMGSAALRPSRTT